MHRLVAGDPVVDVAAAVAAEARPAPPDRPWVTVNMVASLDGAIEVDGRSGPLGPPGDRELFRALRAVADVIVVGAGTARAEGYGPPVVDEATAAARRQRGQQTRPELALVSRSGRLDPQARLFADGHRPLLVVPAATTLDPEVEAAAEVIRSGTGEVDLTELLGRLADRGHAVALVEGGPSLNADLHAADLVDEWCVTLAPTIVGGDASRMVADGPAVPRSLRLDRVYAFGDGLFCRYLVERAGLDRPEPDRAAPPD